MIFGVDEPFPSPDVHCALVLRSGVRYVGHVRDRNEFVTTAVTIDEDGSRLATIDQAEVAAVETFWHTNPDLVCKLCRAATDRTEPSGGT